MICTKLSQAALLFCQAVGSRNQGQAPATFPVEALKEERMRLEKTIPTRTFLAAMSALLFVFATSPSPLQGQAAAGNNTVYSGTSATVTPSTAYIDATA